MREIFTNKEFLPILLLFGVIDAIFFYICDVISIKYAKYCSKKANYNCNICSIYDCKYRYCGKRQKYIERGIEQDVRKNR